MCTRVIWNTAKGGVRVFDVIYRMHPANALFLSVQQFPTVKLELK